MKFKLVILKFFASCRFENVFWLLCLWKVFWRSSLPKCVSNLLFFDFWDNLFCWLSYHEIHEYFLGENKIEKKKTTAILTNWKNIIAILSNSFRLVDFQKYAQWFLRYKYTYVSCKFKRWKISTKNHVQNMPKLNNCGNFLAKTKTWQFWKMAKTSNLWF